MTRNRRTFKFAAVAALLLSSCLVSTAQAATSATLPTIAFSTQSGLNASTSQIQSTWESLKTMGTDQFVGGMIGGFKLDESSMIAGALSIGASEFDNFLRTGSLTSSVGNVGTILSGVMSSSSGINLSSVIGSFTSGGGALSAGSILTTAGVSASGGQCDPSVANDLATQGEKTVNDIVSIGTSKEYGFSQMSSLTGSGATGGFASMGCLDKLFQNTGTDILFKPPTMANLTSMLSNWTCGKTPGVQSQIEAAFGDGSKFKTAAAGGFFPLTTFGEANDGGIPMAPGLGTKAVDMFGAKFANVDKMSDQDITKMTKLGTLFQ